MELELRFEVWIRGEGSEEDTFREGRSKDADANKQYMLGGTRLPWQRVDQFDWGRKLPTPTANPIHGSVHGIEVE